MTLEERIEKGERVKVLFELDTSGLSVMVKRRLTALNITDVEIVNAVEYKALCALFGIHRIPTLAVFEEQKLVEARSGLVEEDEIRQMLE